jgi:integrase
LRKAFTTKSIVALKPREKRYVVAVPQLATFYIRVFPGGRKTYFVAPRDPSGAQKTLTIGSADLLTFGEALERAREVIKRIEAGLAIETKTDTFGDVAAQWMARQVYKNGYRGASQYRSYLNLHILPTWKSRAFISIRCSDVTALLDQIEDRVSAIVADNCLDTISALMSWQATRMDDYVPPIVRGMRRTTKAQTARKRILDDDEIRRFWEAAKQCGQVGAFAQLLLLTAQRRTKVATMRWTDIVAGMWSIPLEAREKTNAGLLKLPEMALAIIEAQPRLRNNPFVFAGRDRGPAHDYGKAKRRIDESSGITGWVFHDLRRTARSLMSRAGVDPNHAERTLGHTIGGVRGIYDRHAYFDEKAIALGKLAALIDTIVNPPPSNVVALRR